MSKLTPPPVWAIIILILSILIYLAVLALLIFLVSKKKPQVLKVPKKERILVPPVNNSPPVVPPPVPPIPIVMNDVATPNMKSKKQTWDEIMDEVKKLQPKTFELTEQQKKIKAGAVVGPNDYPSIASDTSSFGEAVTKTTYVDFQEKPSSKKEKEQQIIKKETLTNNPKL